MNTIWSLKLALSCCLLLVNVANGEQERVWSDKCCWCGKRYAPKGQKGDRDRNVTSWKQPRLIDVRPSASFYLPGERPAVVIRADKDVVVELTARSELNWSMQHKQLLPVRMEVLPLKPGLPVQPGAVEAVEWKATKAVGRCHKVPCKVEIIASGTVVVAVARSEVTCATTAVLHGHHLIRNGCGASRPCGWYTLLSLASWR